MTYLHTLRFWLLITAVLVLGSHVTANAQGTQTYQTGAPTMVAAAPSLPTIPAEQIARDVISEFNPRTGTRELIAAPFDPFEDDPTLAASLRLRSADGAVAIDGRPLQDGALVEIDFYYNSPSDDPYGGRNYSDAGFINGELAPVVLRDTRILECSARVDNVVYDHASYYGGGSSTGIYRPYRHYAGHSSFGFGFGNNYFGPGFGFSNGRSSFNGGLGFNGGSAFGGRSIRGTRSRSRRRALGGADARRDRNDARTDDRGGNVTPTRPTEQEQAARDYEGRLSRLRSYWSRGPSVAGIRRNGRGDASIRSGNTQSRADLASPAAQSSSAQPVSPAAQAPDTGTEQGETRQAQPRRNARQRAATPRAEGRRSDNRRSVPRTSDTRRSETPGSEPRRQSNTRSNTRPKKAKSSRNRRISPGSIKRQLNFFPNDGYGGRSVVTSRSVDCAREDKLRVFIPNERLDAARFDGLTLIALDAQGGETPIYLPPNYIEGYRLAASGQVRPQGLQSAPQVTPPQYSTPQRSVPVPRSRIEAAPCPSGTLKQVDGTCLQTGTVGYPTR